VVLTFDYRSKDGTKAGKPSTGDLAAHVTARLNGGWHSRGSEVHYSDALDYTSGHDFPRYDPDTGEIIKQTFHDRYKRGVRFNFEFTGLVGESDTSAIVLWLTSLVVFLSVAEVAVGFVVFNLLGFRSEVYTGAAKERVIMAERGAKAACQAIQAFEAFERLATAPDGDDDTRGELLVTKETLTRLVGKLPGVEEADAAALADAVVTAFGNGFEEERVVPPEGRKKKKKKKEEEKRGLSFEEWAQLTTEGCLTTDISVKKWSEVGGELASEARGEKLVAPTLFGRSNHKKEEAAAGLRNRRNGKVAPAPAEQPGSWMHEERPTKNASSSSSRTGGDPSRETTMQVKVPAGASPGSTIRFQGPGGNTMEIVVPPGVLPGTLLQVNDPFVANNETQVETISD
jgi:hypothetical protein